MKTDNKSGLTRQKLLKLAKAKKISYFRIMSKTELAEAVKPGTTKSRIEKLQKISIKRWKSGWKFRKNA